MTVIVYSSVRTCSPKVPPLLSRAASSDVSATAPIVPGAEGQAALYRQCAEEKAALASEQAQICALSLLSVKVSALGVADGARDRRSDGARDRRTGDRNHTAHAAGPIRG